MTRVHPLLPLGVLVGFAWIIALANATHRTEDRGRALAELTKRMCTCKSFACVQAVDRDFAKLGTADPGSADDALEAFGADEQYKRCRKTALSLDDVH